MAQRTRLGRYELLETIGQGEILTVYRARDTKRDRPVVLKVIQPHLLDDADLVDRFRREAEKLMCLRHPHIASVCDVNTSAETPYLVMEAPSGESLEQRLAERGPLEIDDVLSFVSQVAGALDYAHDQGVFHRDLRPANIYLDGQTAVLTNFHVLEAAESTPIYMAPEQLDGTDTTAADRRSESYALGVVVYEMLTGRPPFEGTVADVAAAHLTLRPTPPRAHNPELLPALDIILLKTLAKQPHSRYQTAGDLAIALREAVQIAQTRRMAHDGVFDSKPVTIKETAHTPSFLKRESGVPTWAWVGLGILLIVVLSAIILLATG